MLKCQVGDLYKHIWDLLGVCLRLGGWHGNVKRISRELGNRKNETGSTKDALTCENTMFPAAWNQLGIREEKKMGRETDRRPLLMKRQCFAQFGIRSAACRVMFPQQSLETKRWENIREPDSTNWGVRHAAHTNWHRRWTKYSKPFYPVQPPRPQSSMLMSPEVC